ncbi:MAG: glycosyltransferase family 39 protein [Nitrospira sp.]|nr:glycosyltransferase family 39 protein [Nitrospira sp.]
MNNSKQMSWLQSKQIRALIILLVFVAAFVVRLHNINKPPLDFAPIRQYQAAHLTRSYFYEDLEAIPVWKREMAKTNYEMMTFTLEPQIMETLALYGFRATGKENLSIPRVLSIIFWLTGGFFLYLLALKLMHRDAALVSTVLFLFIPYGISASRSFQPDAMMLMMMLISLYGIFLYHESPLKKRLLLAATAAGIAIYIKPYCIFIIYGAFLPVCIYRYRFKKMFLNFDFWLFSLAAGWLPFLHYGIGLLSAGDISLHMQGSFLPYLLLKPYFWMDWLKMIGRTSGLFFFACALWGLFTQYKGFGKTLIAGLWIGYFAYGIFATFHIHTHDYYQLIFLPVMVLSAGPSLYLIVGAVTRHRVISLIILTVLGITASVSISMFNMKEILQENKNIILNIAAVGGINPQFNEFITNKYEDDVRMAEKIGDLVGHNKKNLMLTEYYGRFLTYYGFISGLPWFDDDSLSEMRKRGVAKMSAEDIFTPCHIVVRTHKKTKTRYLEYQPDYFIITNFEEFERQPDLKKYLNDNFPIFDKQEKYLIYDTGAVFSKCEQLMF